MRLERSRAALCACLLASTGGCSGAGGATEVSGGAGATAGATSPQGGAAGDSGATSGASGTAAGTALSGGAGNNAGPAAGTPGSGGALAGSAAGGGAPRPGGTASAGGAPPAAGGGATAIGGAAAGAGATGGIGSCIPAACGSHKWACWKMPNPTGSGLPNPASYTTTADVVRDDVTCLDWQRNPPTATYTNAGASAYCEALSLGGYEDWRAPTRIEQSSILDWTRSPATDAAFGSAGGFHKTGSNWVLTARQIGAGSGTDFAWAFNMSDGIVSNAYSAATAARIRCVRGNGAGEGFSEPAVAPPDQYTILSAEVAQDNYTGLVWQRDGAASGLLSWEGAAAYCEALAIGSFGDWRLPSVRELATLVDEWQVAPSINRTVFPNTKYGARSNNWYWASHARRGGGAYWGLNFDDGFTGFNAGASGAWNYWTQGYAKCVR